MNEEKTEERAKNTPVDLSSLEQEVLEFWQKEKIFEKSLEQTREGKPYVFYDGPPFATGLPHYGSLLPSVIKDAIPRFQTMRGRYVRRRWGWDCHGLPIENMVEGKLGISGKKQIEELGVEKFNQVCRENVLSLASEWGKTIARIGRWVEFDSAYKTMDTSYQESVWWALKQLWDKKLVYQDRKVLLYCARCETPISNFEVAMDNSYRDVSDLSVTVKFRLVPRQRIADFVVAEDTFVLAWTTTPWTLPANAALSVGPEVRYVLAERAGDKYILAKERLATVLGEAEVLQEFSGQALDSVQYESLYLQNGLGETKAFRIYPEEYVTTEDGTGVVHSAPMHGEEDYAAGKKRGLPLVEILDHQGKFSESAPEILRGLFYKDGDEKVVSDLEQRGLLFAKAPHLHSYPHCWRCSTPLYYNALPAWFVDIQKLKQQLLDANEEVAWYPEHLKHGRFELGIKSAPDWNISRNRFWATALPFWVCQDKECGHKTCVGSFRELAERATNLEEVYPNYKLQITNLKASPNYQVPREEFENLDLHKPFIDRVLLKCEKCEGTMRRVPEVVDCWVESGSMPFAELHAPFENEDLFRARFPSDFVVEYIPQTRAWFYVMHVISTALFGRSPFQSVMTTGTILGTDGTKMSKSKGNFPDPTELINRYGADALRFYFLSSPVVAGEDIAMAESGVKEVYQKVSMLLYNVWSFFRLYNKNTVSENLPPSPTHVLDVWVQARLEQLKQVVTTSMDNYQTPRATKEILEFVNDLSTWYLRRNRERMKQAGEVGAQAQGFLGYVLKEFCKVLAPFMPFLTDHIYKDLTGQISVHLAAWPEVPARFDDRALAQMEVVREVVSAVLSLRKDSGFAVRQPLGAMAYQVGADFALSHEHEQLMLEELNVRQIVEYASLEDRAGLKSGVLQFADGRVKVLLDTELTEELKALGLARELERLVQDLRKKSGLKVGDMVDLYYNTTDETVETALVSLLDRKKTFVNQVVKNPEVETDFETQCEVGGKPVWLGLLVV